MNNTASQSGFTLVEMLVAIAVALLFVGGMLVGRDDFDSTVRLGSIAREVALVAREAQTAGAGGGTSGTNFGQPHGIYLNTSQDSQVILYADQDEPPNGYDSGENLEEFELPDTYSIEEFCLTDDTNADDCDSASSPDYPDYLDVYFVRPSLRSNFRANTPNASTSQNAIIDIVHEGSSNTRSVMIDITGYITVL